MCRLNRLGNVFSVGATSLPASAGGSSGQVQYNSGGSLAGNASFTYAPGATTGDEVLITANSISSGNGLDVTSNSTAATGNTQTLAKIALSGANASSSQTTYALSMWQTPHRHDIHERRICSQTQAAARRTIQSCLARTVTQNITGRGARPTRAAPTCVFKRAARFRAAQTGRAATLLLSGGISTGSTGSEIQFLTATNSGSGTTDRNPTLKAVINRSGFFGLGVSSPSYLMDVTGGQIRMNFSGTSTTPNGLSTLSVQNIGQNYVWMEMLNNQGAGKGVFWGLPANNFELWNYQGGSVSFYTGSAASASVKKFEIPTAAGAQCIQYIGGNASNTTGATTYISSGLFSATGTATVANTTTETTLLGTVSGTKTLPTNFFTAGKKATIRVTGTIASTLTPSHKYQTQIRQHDDSRNDGNQHATITGNA
jgi:hypothetical protein